MTKLKLIALALAIAPATAFAGDGPGFAVTGGYGYFDGGLDARVSLPAVRFFGTLESDTSDSVWSASGSWFINKHFAIEVWTTEGAGQSVQIDNSNAPDVNVASYSTAPVTLMAQYHFDAIGRFTPFVAAGWHWTQVSDLTTNPAFPMLAGTRLSEQSGLATAVGVDIALAKGWFARADARWLDSSTDVYMPFLGNATVSSDKTYYGVSLGYRF